MANTVIKSENEYVDALSNIKSVEGQADTSLLSAEGKDSIEAAKRALIDFIRANEKNDDTFTTVLEMWNAYKDAVKNAECDFKVNGLEAKVIYNKLHRDITYTTETLFYGIYLKKHFVESFPKVKNEWDELMSSISFSNSIALYHVLSTASVVGLNKENFAFANILHKLSEISKVYQQYDQESAQINNEIRTWTMGIKADEAGKIQEAVAETVNETEAQ
jgi:hypothetical protein